MTNSKPFAIQIATHFSLRMAMSIKKQLRNKNHAAYIFMHKSTNGKKFYKIRVGAFASRDGAKKYLAVLQKTGLGKRSIIVHR
jgi:cell division septation protein DedD